MKIAELVLIKLRYVRTNPRGKLLGELRSDCPNLDVDPKSVDRDKHTAFNGDDMMSYYYEAFSHDEKND